MGGHPYRTRESLPAARYPIRFSDAQWRLDYARSSVDSAFELVAALDPILLAVVALGVGARASVRALQRARRRRWEIRIEGDRIAVRAGRASATFDGRELVRARVIDSTPLWASRLEATPEGYRVATATLADGRRAFVAVAGARCVRLDFEASCAILAPAGFDDFVRDLRRRFAPREGFE